MGEYGTFLGLEPTLFLANEAIVGEVAAESPAAKAGLVKGDEVKAVDGVPIVDWFDLTERINAADGEKVTLTLDRHGRQVLATVEPKFNQGIGRWLIGIRKGGGENIPTVVKRYAPLQALMAGTRENLK